MRIFHRLGVSGIFLENDAANLSFHDLSDLKQWVMEKILWNPNADLDELIKDFTEKYYGPAGKSIQKYYYALHQAAETHSSHIYLSPSRQAYRYLTPEFLQKADKIFDQAEESVAGNETYLHRVQCARLSLYRAQIIFADELNSGTDVKPLIEKYRKVYSDTIHRRIAPTNYSSFTDGLDKFINHQLSFNTKTTIKPLLPGILPAKVRDYTARDFSALGSKSNFVDSKAVSGLAVKLTIDEKNLALGVNDRNSCKNTLNANIPIDKLVDEYQLIKIGQSQIGDNSVLWITMEWSMTCELCGLEQPGLYDVYVSIRKLRLGEIAVDRVVLVSKSVLTSGKKIR
jgi:hypothetical protein